MVVIVGCGRSGTSYTARLLQVLGLDVGHQKLGMDGIVDSSLVPDTDECRTSIDNLTPRTIKKGNTVLHQVRHPLKTIASARTFTKQSWVYIARHSPVDLKAPKNLRAAQYWFHWNEMAEKAASWTYQLERIPTIFEEFCERVGIRADRRKLDLVPTDMNSTVRSPRRRRVVRKAKLKPLDWDDIHEKGLRDKIRALAAHYGYDV